MGIVFLYAGQGSQCVGMGTDFYENYESYREVVDAMELSFDGKQLMKDGPLEQLSKTEYTQPCMAAFAAGVTKILAEKGIFPSATCGLSLGEYSALFAAGVFDEKTLIKMLAFRGEKMAEAAKGCQCSMSAILGLAKEKIEEICTQCQEAGYVTVANYNCPGQYVICGEEKAVAEAEKKLQEAGAKRCVRLNVSGPFHTKFMKPAGDALTEFFKEVEFRKPQIPVALNVTGTFWKEDEDLKELLVQQVQSSVHLEDDLRALLTSGAEEFVEIGPGNVLTGFLRKTARDMKLKVRVWGIEKVEDLEKFLEAQEQK